MRKGTRQAYVHMLYYEMPPPVNHHVKYIKHDTHPVTV